MTDVKTLSRLEREPSGLRAAIVARTLAPQSIAIIGVSSRPGSAGQNTLTSLTKDGFQGEIFLVGRGGGEIAGRPILPSTDDLPDSIDLAVLSLPAAAVRDAVVACARKKMGGVLIFASGFAESGDEARSEQESISALAEESGVGVIGPNCLGFTNYVGKIDVGFMGGPPLPRAPMEKPGVAIVSQSGGLMGLISDGLGARNIATSYRISTGNEAGLGLSDYIAFMAGEPLVSTIVVYAEHVRKPRQFLEATRRAREAGKTIVMLHAGRGAKARAAAASHTGALAGDYKIMATHVRYAGVLLVETIEELIDCAELATRYPKFPDAGPAVVTSSGAFCALAHDCFEELGLELPPLPDDVRNILAARLPEFTPPQNPLDLTTQPAWEPELIADSVVILRQRPEFGSITVAVPTGPTPIALRWLKPLIGALPKGTMPVQLAIFNDTAPLPKEFLALALEAGLPLNRSPERAMRAIARMTDQGRRLAQKFSPNAHAPFAGLPALYRGTQPEWLGKDVFKAIGVRVPDGAMATTADEAVAVAERIGFPVVLKVQAVALAHKTEIGGVILNVDSIGAVRKAYDELQTRVRQVRPDVQLDGVLVEKMCGKGLELVVGATRDPKWGVVIMVGIGGIFVEALEDVRLIPAGLDRDAIIAELRQLRLRKLLGTFRGAPAPDVGAIAEVVEALGRLMNTREEIVEVDINPLIALPAGQGAIALDALIVTACTASDGSRA